MTNFHRNLVNFFTFSMNACVCLSLTLDTFVDIDRVGGGGGANLFYESKQLRFTSYQRGLPQNKLNTYVEKNCQFSGSENDSDKDSSLGCSKWSQDPPKRQ